jgi:DNA-directed RNA polymerase subunit M/transcription elongation factor TFIIS
MATLITSCPACKKQIKIPADVEGKKIKCKGCGTVFVAVSTAVKPESPTAKPKPAGDVYKAMDDDDDGDGKPYDVTSLDQAPRCPFCTEELEEGAIVCLNCGYNTETRQRAATRRVKDPTGAEWFWWLLPSILCILLFFTCFGELINIVLGYFLLREEREAQIKETWGDFESFGRSCSNCWILWLSIFCIWIMWLTGKYAFKRLVYHFRPPEEELH